MNKIIEKKYYGVIPPIITPIDEAENVDEIGFRNLLDYCERQHFHGIFVAGTNGEAMALTQAQRENAIRIAIDQVGKKIPMMCGVMDTSTRKVIENIKRMEEVGGDCAVITPIFYARHNSQDETIKLFESVSTHTESDLIIYNIPILTNCKLTSETIQKLSLIDKVMGYKDSSGDFQEFQKVLHMQAKNESFSCFQGTTSLAAASLIAGADGYIPSIAPLFPKLFLELFEFGQAKDVRKTYELQDVVLEVQKILGLCKNPIAANKFALSLLGFTHKRVTSPQLETTEREEFSIVQKVEELRSLIRSSGVF